MIVTVNTGIDMNGGCPKHETEIMSENENENVLGNMRESMRKSHAVVDVVNQKIEMTALKGRVV